MNLGNVKTLTTILLLSQLRMRGEKNKISWFRTPKGLLLVDLLVFFGCFIFVYSVIWTVPPEYMHPVQLLSTQIMSFLPLITLSFMIIYGILFVIGESAQFSSSEIINYMPISSTEYVLASSLSSVLMYLFLLTGVLGISLGFAAHLGIVGTWGLAALLSAFFMVVGGFVGEIIRAIINRASSSFSKRGGRSAIIARAILVVFILALSQIFFNPNLLFRLLQSFAPQTYVLWFVPVMWPSLVILETIAGNGVVAAIYGTLTIVFGFILMVLGISLRTRYWVPLPITIRLSAPKEARYARAGLFSKFGFSPQESAIMHKDLRSLLRRKEMIRFLALPIIILLPMVLTYSGGDEIDAMYFMAALICFMGAGMFALFLSMISIGQEGPAIWSLYSSPLSSTELFKAKTALPALLSLMPGITLPLAVSYFYKFTALIATGLISITLLLCVIASLVGSYLGPKYVDLEEKPRSTYIRGTGMLFAFMMLGGFGIIGGSPLIFYLLMKPLSITVGLTFTHCLLASVGILVAISALLFKMASSSMKIFFSEFTGS